MKTLKMVLIVLGLVIFLGGCSTQGYAPRWENRNFGNWIAFDSKRTTPKINLQNVRIVPAGLHTAKISGTVTYAYNEIPLERQSYEEVTYRDYWNGKRTSRTRISKTVLLFVRNKYKHRDGKPMPRQGVPSVVNISNPYGSDVTLKVSSNGLFSGEIRILDKYFFNGLRVPRWYSAYKKVSPSKLRLLFAENEKVLFPSHLINFPKFTFSKTDDESIGKFVSSYLNSLRSLVIINFKEQITRREVSPKVTVTTIGVPSHEEIRSAAKAHILKKLGSNSDVIAVGMEELRRNGFMISNIQNSRRSYNAQSVNYWAYVGASYKIETVHGEYHYFKGFLSPKSSSPVNKTVLLVEKGEKIRVQGVREGEGGSMVDQ